MCTSSAATTFGLHREEAVARLTNREMSPMLTEMDIVRMFVFELVSARRDRVRVFHRLVPCEPCVGYQGFGAPVAPFTKLVCRTVLRSFDAFGRPVTVRHRVRVITPEEYDHAVQMEPESCPLALTGDLRNGRQLLADAATDAFQTVADLRNSVEGRHMLDNLAARAEMILLGKGGGAAAPGAALPSTSPQQIQKGFG
mmetsp:Transcript_80970/g.217200  ORF Transcript_80970/g.217200 Transcript_80970/m.217200 type:complete len:198 (+) Transcript_80970:1504-2097(+)